MPELRQNPATKEWVIIATERAQRPEELTSRMIKPVTNGQYKCPFCPGHEELTPNEVFAFRSFGTKPDTPGWWIRIIPNKFAALLPQGQTERVKMDDFFVHMDGFGRHEVVIESTDHETSIALMQQKQVEEIFLAYRERYLVLCKEQKHEMIMIFKNHGLGAGTSLHHPHSQIVATPITPSHTRHHLEEAMRFFDDNGKCVYCEIMKKEIKAKERVVVETDNFLCYQPFASRSPFETKVSPKEHASTFGSITPDNAKELAFVMRTILAKLHKSLNNPDYNYVINSAPCHETEVEYFHWFVHIIPRVSSVAGFELGSGIYINTVVPEAAAKFLRETAV